REFEGRRSDAAAAFRAYLSGASRRGKGDAVVVRYVERALAHVAALEAPQAATSLAASPTADARGLRVVRTATVEARGPLVAPLIDAAWRLQPGLLDACLADVPLVRLEGAAATDTAASTPRADQDP